MLIKKDKEHYRMAEFVTGKELDEKLTDIIWNARKELVILSPFIRLDNYCKDIVFKKVKNNPELEIIIVFGKNDEETQRSLSPSDLEIFKEFSNVTIIYCKNLHAKYYANENEALLTSLNLLGKSMTQNVEYGIYFQNSKLSLEKLYIDSLSYTYNVIQQNPCVFIKRPLFKKTNLGLTKKYINSEILYDKTDELYRNIDFEKKYYKEFVTELLEPLVKPSREEYIPLKEVESKRKNESFDNKSDYNQFGYCIRTGVKIPFNPERPYSLAAFRSWNKYSNWSFPENYCHKTGESSNGKTSMSKPIL
jgi:hypothetical protein